MKSTSRPRSSAGREPDGHHSGKGGSSHVPPARSADLRRVLRKLDGFFGELQHALRLDDGSDAARLTLAGVRRTVWKRLDAVLQQISPAMIEYEYHLPGTSDRLHEIWLDSLTFDPRQGEGTLLGFMGRVRRLVLDAMGGDPVAAREPKIVAEEGPSKGDQLNVKVTDGTTEAGGNEAAPYTVEAAAKVLGLKPTWLYERTRKNAISHHRYGKYVRFTASDIKEIKAMGSVNVDS
jgi:excisionase family DNA binding protein